MFLIQIFTIICCVPITCGTYTIGEKIGGGGFATVYAGTDDSSHEAVAIKVPLPKESAVEEAQNEIEIIGQIPPHPNIVKFYKKDDPEMIVMEIADGGDLASNPPAVLTESTLRNIFRDVASAVHHLHQNNIAHLDLKQENILIFHTASSAATYKITDFGDSAFTYQKFDQVRGSTVYMSPEILFMKVNRNKSDNWDDPTERAKFAYDAAAADIWQLGVILYQLAVGSWPLTALDGGDNGLFTNSLYEHWCSIASLADSDILYGQLSGVELELRDLLVRMLTVDPDLRITSAGIVNHPWLNPRDERILSPAQRIKMHQGRVGI